LNVLVSADQLQATNSASDWIKAAEIGDAKAQNSLGICYVKGNGVPKDYTEAFKWFQKSAEQGYATAQFNLGLCYYKGNGVLEDLEKAFKWFLKSAERGKSSAQCKVGWCYEGGRGVSHDRVKAYAWFNVAGANGDTNAPKIRDALEKQMSRDQLSEATKLSNDFFKRYSFKSDLNYISSSPLEADSIMLRSR
jgi:hypothetical protein